MTEHYRMGWNDRITKRSEDYGRIYRTVGGAWAGSNEGKAWTEGEREDYARGWQEANTKIATLALPESDG